MMELFNPVVASITVPLVIGVVQVLKQSEFPNWLSGPAALVVGVFLGVTVQEAFNQAGTAEGPLGLAALTGLIAGLMAAGVWSGTKAIVERHEDS